MVKNVTLRGIDEQNYETFKKMAEERNITNSQMFAELISPEFLQQGKDVNIELQNKIESLQNVNDVNFEAKTKLSDENKVLISKIINLENIIKSLNSQLENKANETENMSGFLLDFAGFDLYILKLICKQESERTGREITPAMLLKSMFISYVQEEKTYYFDTPSYFKLKRLQKEFDGGIISIEDFNN